jgi:hypothetical protein
VTDTNAV